MPEEETAVRFKDFYTSNFVPLNRAAKMLGITRGYLDVAIKTGRICAFRGGVSLEQIKAYNLRQQIKGNR